MRDFFGVVAEGLLAIRRRFSGLVRSMIIVVRVVFVVYTWKLATTVNCFATGKTSWLVPHKL